MTLTGLESAAMEPSESTSADAPALGSSTSIGRIRGGLRRESVGFDTELRGYFQRRLRLLSGFIFVAATSMLAVAHLAQLVTGGWEAETLTAPWHLIHVGACFVAGNSWRCLGRKPQPPRWLLIHDAVLFAVTLGTPLAIYACIYERALPVMSGILALFMLARALILPSTVRRTILFAIPVPLVFLAIQLGHGTLYAWPDQELPRDTSVMHGIWNQVVLWMAVVMSAFASRLNFALRRKAYEAKKLDQYVIEGKLGEGGMGEVYRARHALMRRATAVKVLRPDLIGSRALQRFEKEVRLTSALTHPNTIRIYDYGRTTEGDFYYAMELLDGADLERLVDETGPMSAARTIHVLAQACAALHEAHETGLVHRDVKPSNLLLCIRGLDHDIVKVMDFGLVKDVGSGSDTLTGAEEICGSPQTISPEALTGGDVTRQSDLYSLGAVGCFLLTGLPAFDGTTIIELATAHLHKEPIPPSERLDSVPKDLEAILLRCLAKDPAERPSTADEVRTALLACADAGGWGEPEAATWWAQHGDTFAPPAPDAAPGPDRTPPP